MASFVILKDGLRLHQVLAGERTGYRIQRQWLNCTPGNLLVRGFDACDDDVPVRELARPERSWGSGRMSDRVENTLTQ